MYFIIWFSMIIYRGINKKWYVFCITLLICFLIGFIIIYSYNENLFVKLFGTNAFLRVERLTNWLSKDGLQLNKSLIAIGLSGILGNGINNNPIYFPEAHTDFIFTVISSNIGFLGSIVVITSIIYFDICLLNIGIISKNKTYKYYIVGVVSLLLYQQIQSISMTLGLLPITGITLPFISYGGSSLLSYFIMIGIIFNIKENKK